MNRILMIFDYFKEAFELNIGNKILYKPQIFFVIIKTAFVLACGILLMVLYRKLTESGFDFFGSNAVNMLAALMFLLIIIAALWIVSKFVEAGLYNMYSKVVHGGTAGMNDFWDGVRNNFFKFIAVDIITMLAWIPLGFVLIFIGIITLGAGFILVPFLVSVFLAMWKISITADGCGVFQSLRNSINFAVRFFVPYTVFLIIVFALSSPLSSPGFGNNASDVGDSIGEYMEKNNKIEDYQQNPIPDMDWQFSPDSRLNQNPGLCFVSSYDTIYPENEIYTDWKTELEGMEENNLLPKSLGPLHEWVDIVLVCGIGVATIGTALSSLIKMLFDVFFGLSMFVVYRNRFGEAEQQSEVVS